MREYNRICAHLFDIIRYTCFTQYVVLVLVSTSYLFGLVRRTCFGRYVVLVLVSALHLFGLDFYLLKGLR